MDAAASAGSWTGLLVWFLAIVLLIPGSLWLLRRTRLGSALSGQGPVKVLSQTALGAGQRLVIVEVRQDQAPPQTLMLGVTAHQVNLLTVLPQPTGQHLKETA